MEQELKQKQIEELAIRIVRIAGKGDVVDIAEALYDEDCRVIPKGAVVLTRERYEWLTCCFGKFEEILNDIKKSTRKETAEKFAERLKAMAYQSTDWSHGVHPMVVEVDYIDEICEEITDNGVQNGN